MAKTAKAPQLKEPDDGKTNYIVNRAHRVGEPQRWYKPGDKIRLLPCEAQFSLNRGWLRREGDPAPVEKKPADPSAPDANPDTNPDTNTKPKE